MLVLGIETSHDDTSLAIVSSRKGVLKTVTISQIEVHKKYGGTVPEIASRLHVKNIYLALEEIKKDFDLNKIDLIAYTAKPGLIGALQIGFLAAKAIAMTLQKPIVPIDHIEGHFFSASIGQKIKYPALGLVVSGGHTQIILVQNSFKMSVIGSTIDDAVGECYDKIGRKLGLEHPGGPKIDKIASTHKSNIKHHFSIPHTENEYDFSLSGIKTQFINFINNYRNRNEQVPVEDIAAKFQETIVEYLKEKMTKAIETFQPKSIVLCGGVSANNAIRNMFLTIHPNALVPLKEYATDNGAMIAKAAIEIYKDSFKKAKK
ncbi:MULTISPECIES: tRNA (adenosine(37)-N6)-threonylcarbamoyltransferase complex transferase subunit TsaD [unclassified Mycoplasma]